MRRFWRCLLSRATSSQTTGYENEYRDTYIYIFNIGSDQGEGANPESPALGARPHVEITPYGNTHGKSALILMMSSSPGLVLSAVARSTEPTRLGRCTVLNIHCIE